MSEPTGVIAVVTGGASGIGVATVRAFRDAGTCRVVVDRDHGRVSEVTSELAGDVSGVVGDIREESTRQVAVNAAAASFVTGADLLVDGGYVGTGHDSRAIKIEYAR